jgi:FkbM family methyltransferase
VESKVMDRYNVNEINNELKGWDGGNYYGQWETDKLIESYFDKGYKGTCIEVGAADGIKGSNTLYFEKLNWDVLCIEPNPKQFDSLAKHRKNVVHCAISDSIGKMDLTVFDIGEKNIMSSLTSLRPDERLVEAHKHIINDSYKVEVEVETLPNILETVNYPRKIDFISIDTEGTELDVLKGFDFNKYNVTLFVVENNYDDKDIMDFMTSRGYVRDQRYKINDFYIRQDNK